MSLTIKSACALLDLRPDTLRKWERRYGLVAPSRLGNAYRRYTDGDLRRLSAFMEARARGVPGEQAARLARAIAEGAPERGDAGLQRAAAAAVDAFDRAALTRVCAQADLAHGLNGALSAVWIPLLSRLGERALALKGLEIAKEHFAVGVLRERILQGEGPRGRPVLALAAPEGELHEIGMLAVARELQARGVPFVYLGPNLPVDSLAAALRRARLRRVVLCVSRVLTRPALKALARRLRRADEDLVVYLGGPASLPHANLIGELGGVFLGANLELGVAKLARSLAVTPRRTPASRRGARPAA